MKNFFSRTRQSFSNDTQRKIRPNRRPLPALVLAALLAIFEASPANATDLLLPTGGLVSIELLSSDAAFRNTLSLVSPAAVVAVSGCNLEPAVGLTGVLLLSEKTSQHGCRVTLDADPGTPGIQGFAAGTTLRFNMCAKLAAGPNCDYVWSSNPALNSDGFDHVSITPIHSTTYPGQIFQLAWEDRPNGGDMDFNDLIAVVRISQDSDGDGLWDDWEQFGIDTDGDGVVDLDLPALGANPMHKDIFVEVDFMDCALAGGDCPPGDTHSHRPKAAAINAVIQAFANSPVTNPDGTTGINLHVDINNAIAHQNFLNIPGLCFAGGAGIGSFDAVKANAANFGPTNPRRFAYHYCLFTHMQVPGCTSSGCAELPGNDFQVSLGGWNVGQGDLDGDGLPDANVGTVQQQAGTFMHELGHNLNLGHGGSDGVNRKPNYLSAMSYSFQIPGIPPTARLDYSRSVLPSLNENSLTETAGVGDGTDSTIYRCPNGTRRTVPASGTIDWNCDTVIGTAVSDINGDTFLSTLTGFNDWLNLKYDFQNNGGFDDGDHPSPPSDFELELEYATFLHEALMCPDNITAGADPGQCSAVINYAVISALGFVPTCNPPAGSAFPVGTTTVTCAEGDTTNRCSFTVTVEDREAPRVAARQAPNPSGGKIPVAGKNPSSGQNPDGYYQLLSKDNCDAGPKLYVKDNASSFIAGPYANGDIVKLSQNRGGTPHADPGTPPIVAHIHLNGDGLVYAVDGNGNVSASVLCKVPPPDK